MVCLGNICRSPLAEGVLRKKLIENKLQQKVFIDSAGTGNYHIGEAPDIRTQKNAKSHGVDLSQLRARQFNVNDFENFDVIYAMDKSNYQNIIGLSTNPSQKEKVKLFLSESNTQILEVPDPYFGGEEGFELVFNLIDQNCNAIIQKLKSQLQ
jgi:protein-tyrosine phosphatase